MKRLFAIAALSLITLAPAVWAIPTEINYQGTLRAGGVPVNIPTQMTFQLTSQDGLTPYSNTIQATPNVVNGLFSVKLDFQLIGSNTWETITPYIKVTVGPKPFRRSKNLSHCLFYYQQLRGSRCHWADPSCLRLRTCTLRGSRCFFCQSSSGIDCFSQDCKDVFQ